LRSALPSQNGSGKAFCLGQWTVNGWAVLVEDLVKAVLVSKSTQLAIFKFGNRVIRSGQLENEIAKRCP
jgi:hypothetical protein